MDLTLTSDLKSFVRHMVESGAFASEEAVVEAALKRLQEQETAAPESQIDHEFVEFCVREGDNKITLEEVLRATSAISGSMAEAIIEGERADRF